MAVTVLCGEFCSVEDEELVTVTVVRIEFVLLSGLELTGTDVAIDIVMEFMTGGPKLCGPP